MSQTPRSTKMSPGLKVPMGKHDLSIHADITGWSLVCSCGWVNDGAYPGYVSPTLAEREGRQAHAAHVRHMALVHDAQTHTNANCGWCCIYPKGRPVTDAQEPTV